MRDGIRLATDIYIPAQNGEPIPGKSPVILERTPYGKHIESRSERSLAEMAHAKSRAEVATIFVSRGFVVIYQDCRGRYTSEGNFRKYLDDANDGYDTCAWIIQQPWSDGRIGTKGLSYAAHAQAALASLGAPGIAAMFLDSGGFSNAYQGGIRQGGAFEMKQVTWALRQALNSQGVMSDPKLYSALEKIDLHAWFKELPWQPGNSPLSLVTEYEDYLFDQWRRGDFNEFWQQPGIYAQGYYAQFPDCPQVHMSSWYDPYCQTAIDNYTGLSALKKGPIRLIVGPWTHGDRSRSYAGEVDFGAEAPLDGNLATDYWDLRVRWFDHWIHRIENGVDVEPDVHYFRMGGGSGLKNQSGRMEHGGTWCPTQTWPPPEMVATPYYLHLDGGLSQTLPDPGSQPLSYIYDPRNPVPSIGGTITSGEPLMRGGAFDQRETPDVFGTQPPFQPLAQRHDILVFQTPPLTAPLELTGPVEAHLWIASDCPDTDFSAKLIDLHPSNPDYPEGYAMNICDGILRVRYRDSWSHPTLMKSDEIYAISIQLAPTSNLFLPGHRIRLDISSSNFPHFDTNPNTGEPEGAATRTQSAQNHLFVDLNHPSHIFLPIICRAKPLHTEKIKEKALFS